MDPLLSHKVFRIIYPLSTKIIQQFSEEIEQQKTLHLLIHPSPLQREIGKAFFEAKGDREDALTFLMRKMSKWTIVDLIDIASQLGFELQVNFK